MTLSLVRNGLKYQVIKELVSECLWPINKLCLILQVSQSGYYKWVNKDVSSSEQENQQISEEVLIIHQQVKPIYGYRRMTIQINKNLGTTYNPKRIRRIMKQLGISSVIRRSRPAWKSSKAFHEAENKLSR